MQGLGMILSAAGLICMLVGSIWLIVAAFRVSVLWGLGMFVPFVGLFVLFSHWEAAARPFGVSVLGILLMFAGGLATGSPPSAT